MRSSKRLCATTTGCWKNAYRKLFITKILEATTCLVRPQAPTQPSRPVFPSAMLVRQRASTAPNSLCKTMAGPLLSRRILTPHNLHLNLSMQPTTIVHRYPVLLSTHTLHSTSSSHSRTAGRPRHHQHSTLHRKTTLLVKLLPHRWAISHCPNSNQAPLSLSAPPRRLTPLARSTSNKPAKPSKALPTPL